MTLNIFTDDTLTELKRTVEADRLKIPYRVAIFLIQSLDELDIESDNDLVKFISANIDKLDKIIKATFGVSETELDCIESTELISVLKELFKWGIENVNKLGNNPKN